MTKAEAKSQIQEPWPQRLLTSLGSTFHRLMYAVAGGAAAYLLGLDAEAILLNMVLLVVLAPLLSEVEQITVAGAKRLFTHSFGRERRGRNGS